MAVQKSKKSRSKRDARRSHHALSVTATRIDQTSGERHFSHHLTDDGFYRGKHLVQRKVKARKTSEEDGDQSQ